MRYLLTAALLAISAGSGLAQDVTQRDNWTGPYVGAGVSANATHWHDEQGSVGVEINGLFRDDDIYLPFPVLGEVPPVGLHVLAGYGRQIGNAYLGIEGGLDLAEPWQHRVSVSPLAPGPTSIDTSACDDAVGYRTCSLFGRRDSVDRLGDIRGVFGALIDPQLLVFASGGLTFARAERGLRGYIIHEGVASSDYEIPSTLMTGLTLGGGIEFKPTEQLRIRLEGFIDSYPDWSTRDEFSLLYSEGGMVITDETVTTISNAAGRVSLIWQF